MCDEIGSLLRVNPVPRAYARGVLSFDLPVRQAHGPEALEGEVLDRWYGVNTTFMVGLDTRIGPRDSD